MPIVPGSPARAADISALWQVGTELVSFTSATSHLRTINFPVAFASAPIMPAPVISSGAGATARWGARVDTITATSFRLFLFTGDRDTPTAQTWSNIPVMWTAILDV